MENHFEIYSLRIEPLQHHLSGYVAPRSVPVAAKKKNNLNVAVGLSLHSGCPYTVKKPHALFNALIEEGEL